MNIIESKLKAIDSQLKRERKNLEKYKQDSQIAEEKVRNSKKNIKQLELEKGKLENRNKDITITDHAIVRYLQRVKGLDIEAIKKEMLPDKVNEQIKFLGDCIYTIGEYQVICRDNTIITVQRV